MNREKRPAGSVLERLSSPIEAMPNQHAYQPVALDMQRCTVDQGAQWTLILAPMDLMAFSGSRQAVKAEALQERYGWCDSPMVSSREQGCADKGRI